MNNIAKSQFMMNMELGLALFIPLPPYSICFEPIVRKLTGMKLAACTPKTSAGPLPRS